jgi:hypothetical protein
MELKIPKTKDQVKKKKTLNTETQGIILKLGKVEIELTLRIKIQLMT